MTGEATEGDQEIRSPRTLFAQRFAELYEAAGNPTLRRVAAAAETRMRAASGNRAGGASAQRISDWKAGRNVPARFESLLPVVLTLIDMARKDGTPLPRTVTEPKQWQRLWQAATTWNPEEDESACPYLGLTSYRGENRDLFFGRAHATTELTDLVREATGIVALVGASGAGKSSLLAAGLHPALADWEVISLTPGPRPLATLLLAAAPAAESAADHVGHPVDESISDEQAAHDEAGRGNPAPHPERPRRLIVLDQFEELFTICENEGESVEDFLDVLDGCASRAVDPIAVVIAVRADFYAHCLNHPVLQEALEHRSFLLGPMRMDELAQAITGPARAAGLELEPGLEELVITELCGVGDRRHSRSYDPGALPLLSHVMAATWQQREGRKLTVDGYRKAGGVVGSVAETAEHAWNELTEPQQRAAKDILLGLVAVSQDSHDTRRPAERTELLRRATAPEDATAALELLSRTRLITLEADAVNLTHEIVLGAWPRLHGWIDEDRVGYLVRQRLESDAAEWAAQDRDSSLLYRGTRLQNAADNAEPPPVGDLAREFLTASTRAREHTRRRATRTKAALAVLGVVLLVLGFAAYTQNEIAQQQRDDKNFAAILEEADRMRAADPSLAAQLYLVAQRLRPDDADVRIRLLQTQDLPLASTSLNDSVWQMAYRTGEVLATINTKNELRLWNIRDPQQPQQLGNAINTVASVDFHRDGTLMMTSSDTDIRLWDVSSPATPREISRLPGLTDEAGAITGSFVGDSRTLVTLTPAGFTLWDVSNPATPVPGPLHRVHDEPPKQGQHRAMGSIRVSANGNLLAIGSDRDGDSLTESIQLWDITNRAAPIKTVDRLSMAEAHFRDLAFNPAGTVLAVGRNRAARFTSDDKDASVELWDLTDPARPRQLGTPLAGGGDVVISLAFTPDGSTLAVASDSGIALWNVTDPTNSTLITDQLSVRAGTCRSRVAAYPCTRRAQGLHFTQDGRTLLAHGSSGELLAWSVPPSVLPAHVEQVIAYEFDSSGDRMVTLSIAGRIAVWDIRDRRRPQPIGEYRMPPNLYSMALSPDGRTLLVTTYKPAETQVLDLADPADIRSVAGWPQPPRDAGSPYFSRDWRLAAITTDDKVELWDLTDRVDPTMLSTLTMRTAFAWVADISPDNKTLTVLQRINPGDNDELVVTRWDISDPARPVELADLLRQADAGVTADVHITPDQRTMVVVVNEKLRSWDISDARRPRPLGDAFAAHTLMVNSVGFTDDGRTMLTSSTDGTVQLWDFTDPAQPHRMGGPLVEPGKSGRTVVLHPDGRSAIGSDSNSGLRMWDLDVQRAVDRICAVTGGGWSEELWQRYLPAGIGYNPPCD
ncbi:hypothetical protein HLB23_19290 [Nocardia uniformis]|uniref:Novel STAND NTPase 1 domain-containing protein n=1 Tax=Nocardia uniformis TaxID=53432 RepID=A0A849C056_9NOCA|nr:hypothetical protein [Nocardia uniformis]NNH71974.1 hypothetical protein [Nocardia uniformis]